MLIGFLIIIGFTLFLFYRFKSPEYIGDRGESRVARQLKRLESEQYKVLNNVLISTASINSQIDHIVVSLYGIFIIETKNYKGWIHGNENSEYWSQTIYNYKSKFRNPIKQNWAHIYALKEVLSDFEHAIYHPIVVFAGNAELKNIYSKIPVVYDYDLIQTILEKCETPNLSVEQINSIANRLKLFESQNRKEIREHKYKAQEYAYDRKKKLAELICPRCGENLVLRQGPFGKFYGCPNYPKCKYTQKMDRDVFY